jgi:hypothetical protein
MLQIEMRSVQLSGYPALNKHYQIATNIHLLMTCVYTVRYILLELSSKFYSVRVSFIFTKRQYKA